jgi:hypothetical protein
MLILKALIEIFEIAGASYKVFESLTMSLKGILLADGPDGVIDQADLGSSHSKACHASSNSSNDNDQIHLLSPRHWLK